MRRRSSEERTIAREMNGVFGGAECFGSRRGRVRAGGSWSRLAIGLDPDSAEQDHERTRIPVGLPGDRRPVEGPEAERVVTTPQLHGEGQRRLPFELPSLRWRGRAGERRLDASSIVGETWSRGDLRRPRELAAHALTRAGTTSLRFHPRPARRSSRMGRSPRPTWESSGAG